MPPSKMEVNAAIEKLLSEEGDARDLSAAGPLIEFARSLQLSSKLVVGAVVEKSDHTTFTGHTPEAGNVPYSSSESRKKEYSYGEFKERVGYYKVWVHGLKKGDHTIYFQHFWKSDPDTTGASESPPVYHLFCRKNFEPVWLGVTKYETRFELRFFGCVIRLSKSVVVILKGRSAGSEMIAGSFFEFYI